MVETTDPLTVKFDKPGFLLSDVRLIVLLNGTPVYDGGFASGFEVTVLVPPGRHSLETHIDLGMVGRKRQCALVLPPAGGWVASLSYSRFWGNFSKKLDVMAVR